MNYTQLRDLLKIEDERVTIARNTLTSNVEELLVLNHGGQPIVITSAEPGPDDGQDETVVVVGKSSFLGVVDVPAELRANVDAESGDAHIFVKFKLVGDVQGPADWRFSKSFPSLPKVVDWDKTYDDPLTPLLDSLPIYNSYFVLTSRAGREPEFKVPLEPGTNFVSHIRPTAAVGVVKSIFGSTDPFTIYGPVRLPLQTETTLALKPLQYPWEREGVEPGIGLKADLQLSKEVGPLKLEDVNLHIYSPPSEEWMAANQTFKPLMAYTGSLSIGGEGGVRVDVVAPMELNGNELLLLGNFEGVSLGRLAQLADLAGGGDLLSELPEQLKKPVETLAAIELLHAGVSLTFSEQGLDLGWTTFTVGFRDLKWQVWEDHFEVTGLACRFEVTNPFPALKPGGTSNPANATRFDVTVYGSMAFEGVPVNVFASSRDGFTVYAELAEKQTIPLRQLMETYVPGVPPPSDLTVNTFAVSVAPFKQYSLALALAQQPDPWIIDTGVQQLAVSDVTLAVSYPKGGPVAGSFGGTVAFGQIATMTMRYDIPGNIVVRAVLPEIKLTELAREAAGAASLSLPPGFPDLVLKDSEVTFSRREARAGGQTSTGGQGTSGTQPSAGASYDFRLATLVALDGSSGLSLMAEVVKTPTETGFVAGIWTTNWAWSPADLPGWKDSFGLILGGITFQRSGIVISTLKQYSPALQGAPASLPQTIKKGLTFFTEIDFGHSPLAVLKNFFGGASTVKLYALIADPLDESMFVGLIGDSTTTGYGFIGLRVTISPATKSFAMQTGVSFTFTDVTGDRVTLTFIGGGMVNMAGDFNLFFILKADEVETADESEMLQTTQAGGPPARSPGWKDPLGIKGLTIENFWGQIGAGPKGLQLGFGGTIDIQDVRLELALVGGFQGNVPYVSVFKFEIGASSPGQSIKITDLVKKFTTYDISWVPLLDQIALKEFMVAVVLEPLGWTNPATLEVYLPGFYTSGDVLFFGFELVFNISIYFQKGIKAWGYVDKALVLGDGVFVISAADNLEKGPYALIDTLALTTASPTNEYIRLSGEVKLLGMSALIDAAVTNDGWAFRWKARQFIFEQEVICLLSVKDKKFRASARGSLDLDVDTKSPVTVAGVEIIPRIKFSLHIALGIEVAVNPGFRFAVTGEFAFGGQSLSVTLELNIRSWDELADALKRYFEDYPKELFNDLVNSAEKWAKAVGEKLIQVAGDAAQILKDAYGVVSQEAAKLLKEMGYAAEQAVEALKRVWDVSEEEARKLINAAWETAKKCATTTAAALM
jgi:hypothetical protein